MADCIYAHNVRDQVKKKPNKKGFPLITIRPNTMQEEFIYHRKRFSGDQDKFTRFLGDLENSSVVHHNKQYHYKIVKFTTLKRSNGLVHAILRKNENYLNLRNEWILEKFIASVSTSELISFIESVIKISHPKKKKRNNCDLKRECAKTNDDQTVANKVDDDNKYDDKKEDEKKELNEKNKSSPKKLNVAAKIFVPKSSPPAACSLAPTLRLHTIYEVVPCVAVEINTMYPTFFNTNDQTLNNDKTITAKSVSLYATNTPWQRANAKVAMYARPNNEPYFSLISSANGKVRISNEIINAISNRAQIPIEKCYLRDYMNAKIEKLQLLHMPDQITIDFGFVDNQNGQHLYCVILKQDDARFPWMMVPQLFTEEQISAPFAKDSQLCLVEEKEINHIKSVLNPEQVLNRKWKRTTTYVRKNGKIRNSTIMTPEYLCFCAENSSMHFIPIMSSLDKNITDLAWIIQIDKRNHIALSLNVKNEKNIFVNGIHADKNYVLQQHCLVNPQHISECECLDTYEFGANDVQISNPDFWFNQMKIMECNVRSLLTISHVQE